MDARQLNHTSDIVIVGGSLAGMTFACLLQQYNPDLSVCLINDSSTAANGKTIVINRAAATCLQKLNALPPASKEITQVRISLANVLHKTIGGSGTILGYSIEPQQVQQQLLKQIPDIREGRIKTITPQDDGVILTTENGDTIQTRLLVAACPLPMLPAPFATRRLRYRQTILSLQAASDLPPTQARQRFSPRRVLVLVPRAADDDSGVIICAAAAAAGSISALSDNALSAYLSDAFNLRIRVHGKRFSYTPQLAHTTPLVQPPIILLGSGATTLHPIGAQAISLAIEDARQLAEIFQSQRTLPPPAAFAAYQKRRTPAHRTKGILTSALALGAFGAGELF